MFSLPPPPEQCLCGLQTPEETLEQLENNNNIVLGEGVLVGLKENKEAEEYNFRSNSNIFLSGIVDWKDLQKLPKEVFYEIAVLI